MEFQTLEERPDLREKCLKLMSDCFPKGAELSHPIAFDLEFPTLLNTENSKRILMLIDQNEVVSAGAWTPIDVREKITKKILRFAGVGLIVSTPSRRNQGLSRSLQLEIERRALQENCVLSVLWSDLFQFYSKLGYLVAGQELHWNLDAEKIAAQSHWIHDSLKAQQDYNIEEITNLKAFSQEAYALYEKDYAGPLRGTQRYLGLDYWPNTHTYLAKKNGVLKAYLVQGKARDLRNCVHEIVGEKEAIAPLLLKALKNTNTPAHLEVQLSSNYKNKEELEFLLGANPSTRPLGFFKILNVGAFFKWMENSGYLPLHLKLRLLDQEKSHWQLLSQRGLLFDSTDAGHLIQIFFGPWLPKEIEGLSFAAQQDLEGLQPLDFYFWGLDSV